MRQALGGGSAGGIARVLLVTAALTGFLLMHGLAATDSAGAHHVVGEGSHSGTVAMASHGAHLGMAAEAAGAGDRAPMNHDDAAMAGCVFILLAFAGGIVLRAMGTSAVPRSAPSSTRPARQDGPARAPPSPVFVSLCVFRL